MGAAQLVLRAVGAHAAGLVQQASGRTSCSSSSARSEADQFLEIGRLHLRQLRAVRGGLHAASQQLDPLLT